MTNARNSGNLPMALLLLLLFGSSSAFAEKSAPLRCTPQQGTSSLALARLAEANRTNDSFYRQLLKWKGPPSVCKGSVGQGEAEGESSLELGWPDGSIFETSSMLPETYVVHYRNARGLARADETIAAVRAYAARQGLHIDWTSPLQREKVEAAGTRVTEYVDPGVNGSARLAYDRQQRLVAVSLNMAL